MKGLGHPLIRLVISFTSGMVGANFLSGQTDSHFSQLLTDLCSHFGNADLTCRFSTSAFLFLLTVLCFAISFFLHRSKRFWSGRAFDVVILLFAFLVGMTLFTHRYERLVQSFPQDTTYCQGTLATPPAEKAHSWAVNIRQEDGTHLLLYIGKDSTLSHTIDSTRYASLQTGDTLRAFIHHLTPTNTCSDSTFAPYYTYLFHHDVVATAYVRPQDLGRQNAPSDLTPKNGRSDLTRRNDGTDDGERNVHPYLGWLITISEPPERNVPSVMESRNVTPSLSYLQNLQERMHLIYDEHGIRGETGSVIEAMTIGRKSDLSPQLRQAYSRAGVSHVLALSGFHVGVIVMLMQAFFLTPILPWRWRWTPNAVMILLLWTYTYITGLSPSLVRATTMFTLLLLLQEGSGKFLSLDSCALTFLVMLCYNPFYLFDVGFQLSFLSVLGISLWFRAIFWTCPSFNPLYQGVWCLVGISLVCSLFTAPMVAYHFGEISIASVVSNLVISILVYIIMWGSILWWLSLGWSWGNELLSVILGRVTYIMNEVIFFISSQNMSTFVWKPHWSFTFLIYLCIIFFTYYVTKKVKITRIRTYES